MGKSVRCFSVSSIALAYLPIAYRTAPLCFVSAALLYLNPALLGSAFATALLNGDGELQKLLSFGLADESEDD